VQSSSASPPYHDKFGESAPRCAATIDPDQHAQHDTSKRQIEPLKFQRWKIDVVAW
jgi:hypothetical protein